ncbi:MFS transporter [Priestia abyssalis]|uniref:MFS transporter n=1 Tax=Priestia abyssalis TaxID=1221450 RepID=UPI000995A7A5|nr:aromatic acid/H+ symport family MFS transporter [Priestia abyssalis]
MRSINITKMVDESKFNRFHSLVLALTAFIIIFDGFDLVVYGTVVPVLMEEWGLTPVQAGSLGSYALFGMMIGALIFGPLADKFGRKNMIILCTVIFSVFTGVIGFATSPAQFGIFRFIAGIGLGGVMPNVVALITEYSPKTLKTTLVSIMFSGYAIGGIFAAALGIYLIPNFGWQSMFFVGAFPLITLPFIYKYLPDSLGFLLAKNKHKEIGQVLAKVNPSFIPQQSDEYEMVIPGKTGITVAQLFKDGRAFSTLMFWTAFFMCLLMVYGLNTWLPKLMAQAGYPLGSSLMFLLALNAGAILGAILGGRASDRWNVRKVLIAFFIMAAVSLTLLGFEPNTFALYTLVAIAGAATIGTQIILYAGVSQHYPTHMRSTGIGWASGVGRTGAIIGPILGGYLLTMNLPLQQNFLAFAIPGAIAAIAMAFVREKTASAQSIEVSAKSSVPNMNILEK